MLRTRLALFSLGTLAALACWGADAQAAEPTPGPTAPAAPAAPALPPLPTPERPAVDGPVPPLAAPSPAPDAAPAAGSPPLPAAAVEADRGPEPIAGERDARRAEGLRLALDAGFQRAIAGAQDRLNAATPTLLPLGLDASIRTSPSLLVGVHGYAALASRDDCLSGVDSCRARAYGFGAHVETPLGRSPRLVPWLRYGVTYEILYQGGAPLDPAGHVFRDALDLVDLRIGADLVVSGTPDVKSARVGAYLGLVGGFLVSQSGVSYTAGTNGRPQDLDRSSGSAHMWFTGGLRATFDP
jgi:hypothetical protein